MHPNPARSTCIRRTQVGPRYSTAFADMLHVLDTEYLRRRNADRTRLRHDVLLVDEPRHRLTGDARDGRARGRQLDAVRLVHPATREANEPLDLVATDRPHH